MESTGFVGALASDIECAAELHDGRCVDLAYLNALAGELSEEELGQLLVDAGIAWGEYSLKRSEVERAGKAERERRIDAASAEEGSLADDVAAA